MFIAKPSTEDTPVKLRDPMAPYTQDELTAMGLPFPVDWSDPNDYDVNT